ncbi:MAG TPA: STAS/SEC14 domain-containing protein [Candidatus Paceibacterota bacterium]|nr:STAS/SEC14 domain-containing protein [Candidatus Paceibacterota bacterium]
MSFCEFAKASARRLRHDRNSVCRLPFRWRLVKADYPGFVSEFERLLRQHGKLRVLFNMTSFTGWDAGAAREDIKFDLKHFADIEQPAMVGDKQWQHGLAVFFKPFTKATIRYFDHTDIAGARKWLAEA